MTRIAVLSDIHGNLEALEAVLADIDTHNVDAIYNLGDTIGYGPDPETCIHLVRERGMRCVLGNHEEVYAPGGSLKWFNFQTREIVTLTRSLLSAESKEWCGSLPRFLVHDNARFVHAFPPASVRVYLDHVHPEPLKRIFSRYPEHICFVGHTHDLNLVRFQNGSVEMFPMKQGEHTLNNQARWIVNAGSVGQPRDGDVSAKWVLWDGGTVDVRFVPYDPTPTILKMKKLDIPERYASRLLGI